MRNPFSSKNTRLLALPVLAVSIQLAWASPASINFDSLWQQVEDSNLSLIQAENALRSAEQSLGISGWESSRISASSSTQTNVETGDSSDLITSIDVSLPVTSQLTVGANLSTADQISLSASYQPFASDWVTPQMTLNYEQASLSYQQTQTNLYSQLEDALLQWQLAERNMVTSEQAYSLASKETAVTEAQLAAGKKTVSDLLDAQKAQTDALQSKYSAQLALAEAEQSLLQLTSTEALASVADINAAELAELVKQRAQYQAELNSAQVNSYELKQLEAEESALTAEANDLAFYDSDLTFTASYDVSKSIAKAGVSINLSPSQFNQSEIVDAQTDITLKKMAIDNEKRQLQRDYELALERIDIQQTALASAEVALVQRQATLEKVNYLLELGEQTELEQQQAQLSVLETENQLYSALVSLYQAQANLFALIEE